MQDLHTAFDANIVGIRPDYVVQVPRPLLEETDGDRPDHRQVGGPQPHRRRVGARSDVTMMAPEVFDTMTASIDTAEESAELMKLAALPRLIDE